MTQKFMVRWEYEVKAENPKQAAIMARDAMLDPEMDVKFDVHEFYYHEEADDYFPVEDHGWYASFDKKGVRPEHFFPWERVKRDASES